MKVGTSGVAGFRSKGEHVQARAVRMEVEQTAEHNGPSIWAVRPIAVRADDASMDD